MSNDSCLPVYITFRLLVVNTFKFEDDASLAITV